MGCCNCYEMLGAKGVKILHAFNGINLLSHLSCDTIWLTQNR